MGFCLTTVTATLLFLVLGERLTRRHHVHKLLWKTCGHRTNTAEQLRFERLKRFWIPIRAVNRPPNENDVVTFDLTEGRNGSLVIEIPDGSGWSTLQHTHTRPDGCSNLTILSGCWYVGSAIWPIAGSAPPEQPGLWTSMGKPYSSDYIATVRLSGTVSSRYLDHLLCSLVQDAVVYFRLCTTPIWVRALYVFTWLAPRLREMLVHRLLWVQIRATLHMHDFLEDQGTITIFRWINPWSPPAWVYPFEERMRLVKSKAISGLNYWLSRNVFGMSIRYEEYEPTWKNKSHAQK